MDALEAIQRRRSVREYTGDAIPREDIEKIVDAGRLAATGNNKQPWDFIVITKKDMIEKLKVASQWMENAGAIIAVVLDPSSRWWIEDGAASVKQDHDQFCISVLSTKLYDRLSAMNVFCHSGLSSDGCQSGFDFFATVFQEGR
jgi:nitroreductase